MCYISINGFCTTTTYGSGCSGAFYPVAAAYLIPAFNDNISRNRYWCCFGNGATCYPYVIAATQLAEGITNGCIRIIRTAGSGNIGAARRYISKIAIGCAYIYRTYCCCRRGATAIIIGNTNRISSGGGRGCPVKSGTGTRCWRAARCCPCKRGYIYRRSRIGRL